METIHDPKREVELIFCEALDKEVKDLLFYPNKGDKERETPFGAVICEDMSPLMGGAGPRGYLCKVKVVYVSHMDETTSQEHGVFISKIEDALSRFPQNDPALLRYIPNALLFGYTVSSQKISSVEHHLKTLEAEADIRILDGDPKALAFALRQAIFCCKSGRFASFSRYARLGDHYTFSVEADALMCEWTITETPNLYITVKRRLKIAGLFMEALTTSSEDQSFGDVFTCKVGVIENC
jgi:hypothetical protein